jgi:hypothetical protein
MAMTSEEEESDSESEAGVKRRESSVDSDIARLESKGLLTAKEMARIQEYKSKEAEINKRADEFKGANTVFRVEGVKKTLDQIKNAKEEWKKKQEKELKKWSGGLVQKEQLKEKKEALRKAKASTFANYQLD